MSSGGNSEIIYNIVAGKNCKKRPEDSRKKEKNYVEQRIFRA